jgi:high-affinity iron transporter
MLNAGLIVFRETLEAALIIGILAAATRTLRGRTKWITLGAVLGASGAVLIASVAEEINRWANGLGQDMFNAIILAIAVVMLSGHSIWMSSRGRQMVEDARRMGDSASRGDLALSAVAIAVALTVLREGAEAVLFFFGLFAGSKEALPSLVEGALIGFAGGAATGVLVFRGLMRIPVRHIFTVTGWLLIFVTAGMAAQLAQILIQADLLSPLIQPLWDTSRLVPPDSSLGAALHALVGYDPQPSATQVVFAGVVLLCVLVAGRLVRRR